MEREFENLLKTVSEAFEISCADTEKALNRSQRYIGDENLYLLSKAIAKIKRGEKTVFAGLGGSITEGACAKTWANGGGNNKPEFTEALGGEKCWLLRVAEWLHNKSGTEIEYINAGIGATPSFLGVHRFNKMILARKPDIMTLEFSVNDPSGDKLLNENEIFESYEAIIRKCLENEIALILVFMTQEQKQSFAEKHSIIGKYYHLPMISYHDAIWQNDSLICDWKNLSPDDIHPNNAGHTFLSLCIENYLDSVWDKCEDKKADIPEKWLYSDKFIKAQKLFASDHSAIKGFHIEERLQNVSPKWGGLAVSDNSGDSITFTVPKGTERVFVSYQISNAKLKAEFAGTESSVDCFVNGWPKIIWTRIYDGAPIETDKKMIITNLGGRAMICGIEIS